MRFKQFFSLFPESTISVADYPRYQGPERKWYDFTEAELQKWNSLGYGIFFTPCSTNTAGHKTENFASVNSWYCDIDCDIFEEKEKLNTRELEDRKAKKAGEILFCDGNEAFFPSPSLVIETRSGFHCYWFSFRNLKPEYQKYTPTMEGFERIQRIIGSRFGGDPKASKLVQLMRVPGFNIHKYGQIFPVEIRNEMTRTDFFYDEDSFFLLDYFREKKKEWRKEIDHEEERKLEYQIKSSGFFSIMVGQKYISLEPDVFEEVKKKNQQDMLQKLSGTPYVNGEVYTFRPSSGGKHLNIFINNKGSSHFIDLESNKIFVPSGSGRGSPNVIEWLKWYGHEGKELANIIKTVLL